MTVGYSIVSGVLAAAVYGTACSGTTYTTYMGRPADQSSLEKIRLSKPGEVLTVESDVPYSFRPVEGTLIQLRPTTTQMRAVLGDRVVVVDNASIRRVGFRSRAEGKGAKLGFLLGAVVGGSLAYATYSDPCANATSICLSLGRGPKMVLSGAVLGLVLALPGAIIGHALGKTTNYEFVSVTRPLLPDNDPPPPPPPAR